MQDRETALKEQGDAREWKAGITGKRSVTLAVLVGR